MSCAYAETLCDPSGNPVFVTGTINETTGALTSLKFTNLDGSIYAGSIASLINCANVGASGAGDAEVGEGDTLPSTNAVYELFRLEGHLTLPDGLYWWSEEAGQWVQT